MSLKLLEMTQRYSGTTAYLAWISVMASGLFVLQVIDTWTL